MAAAVTCGAEDEASARSSFLAACAAAVAREGDPGGLSAGLKEDEDGLKLKPSAILASGDIAKTDADDATPLADDERGRDKEGLAVEPVVIMGLFVPAEDESALVVESRVFPEE